MKLSQNNFKVGDIVALLNSHKAMTIIEIDGDNLTCIFWDYSKNKYIKKVVNAANVTHYKTSSSA